MVIYFYQAMFLSSAMCVFMKKRKTVDDYFVEQIDLYMEEEDWEIYLKFTVWPMKIFWKT